MGKIFGCFGVLLLLPIMVIGLLLFNSWYLQVIYNIGLTPVLSQFGLFLPQLGFWVFVLIDVVIGGIKLFFTNPDKPNTNTEAEKKTYNIYNKDEFIDGVTKAFSPITTNVLTKLAQLGLLAIAFNICF